MSTRCYPALTFIACHQSFVAHSDKGNNLCTILNSQLLVSPNSDHEWWDGYTQWLAAAKWLALTLTPPSPAHLRYNARMYLFFGTKWTRSVAKGSRSKYTHQWGENPTRNPRKIKKQHPSYANPSKVIAEPLPSRNKAFHTINNIWSHQILTVKDEATTSNGRQLPGDCPQPSPLLRPPPPTLHYNSSHLKPPWLL